MRFVAAVLGLLGLMVAPTLAQDAPHDWTGGYLGLQLGMGSGGESVHFFGGGPPNLTTNFTVGGPTAGVTGGYDWQIGSFILGVNGQINGAMIGGAIVTTA